MKVGWEAVLTSLRSSPRLPARPRLDSQDSELWVRGGPTHSCFSAPWVPLCRPGAGTLLSCVTLGVSLYLFILVMGVIMAVFSQKMDGG